MFLVIILTLVITFIIDKDYKRKQGNFLFYSHELINVYTYKTEIWLTRDYD